MKQKKQVKKEKDNYLKMTFLFPVVTSIVDAVIVLAALLFSSMTSVENPGMVTLLMQAATVLVALSPTMLLINAFLSHRHTKKYPDGSPFYIKTPMLCSFVVWGAQVLYLVTLTGA